MPSESEPSRPSVAPLLLRVGHEANAAQIADAFFAIWEEIDDALTPIIGSQGVVALYRRSVRLALADHPWLAGGIDGERSTSDPRILKSVRAPRDSTDAAAAGSGFLQTFHDLLGSLVGPSLTERLLRSVWTNSPSGTAAQDTQP